MSDRPEVMLDYYKSKKQENNFAEQHRKVLDELHELAVKKNHDYGNSFSQIFQEYGLQSTVIRLADKFHRLKTLVRQPAQVKDESIRDTLMDMANYCILTVMELDKKVKWEEEHAIEMNKVW